MSITSALLNAQRRPEAEAQRFTEAVSRALAPEDEDSPPNVDATIAAEEAMDRTSEEIADEKAPRRAAPPSGYLGEFTESESSSFDDDGGEPFQAATHRLSPHYRLDDISAAEPEMDPEFASEPPDEEPADDTGPEFEPAPERSTGPWAPDPHLVENGYAVATPEPEAPAETPAETGSLAPLVAPPLSNMVPPQNGAGPLGAPGAAPVDPVDPADLGEAEEPVDEAEAGDASEEGAEEAIDGAPNNDLTAGAIDGLGGDPSPGEDTDAPTAPTGGGSSPYTWDRRVNNPWGDDEEVVPSAMASEPTPAPAADDSPVIVPAADTGEAEVEEGDDPEMDGDPVPSTHATAPPESLEAPEPESEPSLLDRVRGALTLHNLRRQVTEPKQALKVGLAVVAVIVVVIVVGLSFRGGGRGEPTTPAGTVAPPPSAGENTATAAKDGTLVPSTVSASCGNDSDSVAPFSGDKTRAWVCKRINGLDLNVLNITFNKPMVITSITIVPGFNYIAPDGRDEWSRHRLVTAVSWRMGGKVYPQNIAPTRTGVTKQFDSVITQEMSMTITGSTRPPVGQGQNKGFGGAGDANDPKKIDENTAISQIVITGHPVDPGSGAAPGALQPGN